MTTDAMTIDTLLSKLGTLSVPTGFDQRPHCRFINYRAPCSSKSIEVSEDTPTFTPPTAHLACVIADLEHRLYVRQLEEAAT